MANAEAVLVIPRSKPIIVKRTGRHALKARMPRCLPDHRSSSAKRLRRAFDELAERFPLTDGVTRRLALLAAQAAVEHEDASALLEIGHRQKRVMNRLRRRQRQAAGAWLSGIRHLEEMTAGRRPAPPSLADTLAQAPRLSVGDDGR